MTTIRVYDFDYKKIQELAEEHEIQEQDVIEALLDQFADEVEL